MALSSDARRMEAPAWASFNAVESLTENHGIRSGVSAWAAVGTAEGGIVINNGKQQPAALQANNVNLASVLSSASASHWLDQGIAAATACSCREKAGPACTLEMAEGNTSTKPRCQATVGAGVIAHNCADEFSDSRLSCADIGKGQAPSAAIGGDTLQNVNLGDSCQHKHHSLILSDLSLRDFDDWKSRIPSTEPPQAQDRSITDVAVRSEGLQDLQSMSEDMTSTSAVAIESKSWNQMFVTSCGQDDAISSQGYVTQATRKCKPSEHTPPFRSPDQQHSTLACVPSIGSLSDLSRGLIPSLPQVYPGAFPCFHAISALYWKFKHSQTGSNQGVISGHLKLEHDTMLIDDCLDRSIEHCEMWCAAHGQYGAPHHDFRRFSVDGSHASCSTGQIVRGGTATPVPATPPGKQQAQIVAHSNHQRTVSRSATPDCAGGKSFVTVPGWVPQVSTALVQQRWYCVVAGKDHPEVTELVGKSLKELGWKEDGGPAGAGEPHMWNLCWTWSVRARVPDSLLTWQRVNHFQECR